MYPMTVTVHNAEQLQAVMQALGEPAPSADKPAPTGSKKAAGKAETSKKPAPEKEPQATAPVAEEEQVAEEHVYSYQEAATAVTSLATAKGRSAAVEVLGKFGASKLPDLAAEKYGELIAACKKAQEE